MRFDDAPDAHMPDAAIEAAAQQNTRDSAKTIFDDA